MNTVGSYKAGSFVSYASLVAFIAFGSVVSFPVQAQGRIANACKAYFGKKNDNFLVKRTNLAYCNCYDRPLQQGGMTPAEERKVVTNFDQGYMIELITRDPAVNKAVNACMREEDIKVNGRLGLRY